MKNKENKKMIYLMSIINRMIIIRTITKIRIKQAEPDIRAEMYKLKQMHYKNDENKGKVYIYQILVDIVDNVNAIYVKQSKLNQFLLLGSFPPQAMALY